MGWNPSPGDPRHDWRAFEFCIYTTQMGLTDGPEIDLIYRRLSDPGWSPVGHSDGMIYCMGPVSWDADVAAAGGFPAWWAAQVAEINSRLAVVCALIDPAAPALQIVSPGTDAPATFTAFQAWLKPHVQWTGTPIPPPSSGFVTNLALNAGKQRLVLTITVDEKNESSARLQRWIGPGADDWQKVSIQ